LVCDNSSNTLQRFYHVAHAAVLSSGVCVQGSIAVMGWSPRSPALQLLLLLAATATASAGRFEHGYASTGALQPSSLLGPLPALTRRLLGIRAAADQQLQPGQHAVGRKLLVPGGTSTCSVDASSLSAANSAVRAEATMSVDYGTSVTGYFRMRFVDCSPANSTICTNSTYNGQPGVFEVGGGMTRHTCQAVSAQRCHLQQLVAHWQ